MNIRRRHNGVNAWPGRAVQRFSRAPHVHLQGAAKSGHGNLATLGRDCLDRGKVAFRGNRESGFDDIDSERLEFLRQVHLLLEVHGTARRLLAVAQRRVEDSYPLPCHHTPPSNSGLERRNPKRQPSKSQSYNIYDKISSAHTITWSASPDNIQGRRAGSQEVRHTCGGRAGLIRLCAADDEPAPSCSLGNSRTPRPASREVVAGRQRIHGDVPAAFDSDLQGPPSAHKNRSEAQSGQSYPGRDSRSRG